MIRTRAVVIAFVVALSVASGGTAAAQEDLVTLTVTVTTASGDPVGDAELTATWDGGSRSRTTASNGMAFLDVPEGADVEISVEHGSYVRNFPASVEDAGADEVSLTVYPKSSSRVTVTDGDGPVEDATVVLRKDRRDVVEATTDADGVVNSGTIESGDYTVIVTKAGYYVTDEDVAVSGDVDLDLSIRRGTVTLEVNVTDDHFDPPRPVGEATVDVRGSGSVVTQPGGIGRISVPVNAWTNLDVSKDGYDTTTRSEFISEADEGVDVTIQRTSAISTELLNRRVVIGESVSLSVTDEYGDPVSGAAVRVDGEVVAETDANGQAVVQIDDAGDHTVVAQSGSLQADPQTVVGVAEGDAVDGETDGTEPTETDGETAAEVPGFGVLAALFALALVVIVGLAGRSRRP